MTGMLPIDTDAGWMSPVTSPAMIAYGTLWIGERGSISGSVPTVIAK
jgi:hypothetical protein